jgi:hypothetical protein
MFFMAKIGVKCVTDIILVSYGLHFPKKSEEDFSIKAGRIHNNQGAVNF